MIQFANIEFYNTPEGDVMMKEADKPVRKFTEQDRDLIAWLLYMLRENFPEAHQRLMELYSRYERNRTNFEYKVVHRFLRCNFGEYDQFNYDISRDGFFKFEEVRCPLRGECPHEGCICRPVLNTNLSDRELEVFRLIAQGAQADEIAGELNISPLTVNRHRENIKIKTGCRSVAELVRWWNEHDMK